MTTHTLEFNAFVQAHIVELESDIAYEEKAKVSKLIDADQHRRRAANLDTEVEVHSENIQRLTVQILELKQALE